MSRKRKPAEPQPTLLFSGISESQWRFLRLRAFDESDAVSARGVGISARTVEGWKRRGANFRAFYAFALAQPRLKPRLPWLANFDVPLVQSGLLLSREHPDIQFEREVRQREFAIASRPENRPPPVDLEVPEQHRRIVEPEREMDAGERGLAEALGVEHCLVLGYWNGQPSPAEPSSYERAADAPSQYTPGFRMPTWYPDGVIATSAGLIVVADGRLSQSVPCPAKRRSRCPLVDRRGVGFASCSYWDFALAAWLDIEPPNENNRSPICHRDFAITRLLVYLAAVTRRSSVATSGHAAGFPVIAVRDETERSRWTARAEQWNKMLLDPWRHIRVVDCGVLIEALVGLRVAQQHSSWTEDSPR